MLKRFGIIKEIGRVMEKVADDISDEVIRKYPSINAREEDLTSKLDWEITTYLLEKIANTLNKKVKINGITFGAYTFTKREEKTYGADIAGILEIDIGGQVITKGYLAQAKIGKAAQKLSSSYVYKCYSSKLQSQITSMLKQTSDSFIFIYTEKGIAVVPGFRLSSPEEAR